MLVLLLPTFSQLSYLVPVGEMAKCVSVRLLKRREQTRRDRAANWLAESVSSFITTRVCWSEK